MKKIISFSLWGNNPKYTSGVLRNIHAQKILFPDWICRFYVHPSVECQIWEDAQKEGAEIIFVDEDPQKSGMLWRFRPLSDPDVYRFIVRDTDGVLTQREKNSVLDWIASKKEFHIIRDHPHHGTRIMGGMWGATKEFISRINYQNILDSHDFENTPHVFGYDQDFLASKIYPLIKNTACIHDDYHLFKDESPRRIPHIREGNHFIGEPIEL